MLFKKFGLVLEERIKFIAAQDAECNFFAELKNSCLEFKSVVLVFCRFCPGMSCLLHVSEKVLQSRE